MNEQGSKVANKVMALVHFMSDFCDKKGNYLRILHKCCMEPEEKCTVVVNFGNIGLKT